MTEAEIGPGILINDRYRVQRVLGQGGFGRTYLTSDEQRFNQLVVLKEFVPTSREEYKAQKSRELFEREAKVLYEMDHPQIPKFIAWFPEKGRLFIVQQYINGKTYAQLLRERQQQGQLFSEAEVIQWLRDLLAVLTYLHGRFIIHRDISPDNVMLPAHQSQPVLIDFGLVKEKVTKIWDVKAYSVNTLQQDYVVGKTCYAPPEQLRMGKCFPCTDLYALAVTALVLLSGKEPGMLMDPMSLEWQWQSQVKVSDQLSRTLEKMLEERPQNRYQSAQEVLAELQHFAEPGVIAEPKMGICIDIEGEIDQEEKRRELSEIAKRSYFERLQRQSEEFRTNVEIDPTKVSMLNEETDPGWPSRAVKPKTQSLAATPPKLTPVFLESCRRELVRYLGPMGAHIVEEKLDDHPNIHPVELVEALAAEIMEALAAEIDKSQKAQEFRNRVKIDP